MNIDQVGQSDVTPSERYKYTRQISELKSQLKAVLDESNKQDKINRFAQGVQDRELIVRPWKARARSSKTDKVTAVAFLSDCHFDEHVRPEQVAYMNEYTRSIAQQRLRNFFENIDRLAHHFMGNVAYDNLVLPFGGDFFSGDIHTELAETNESLILESVLFWATQLAEGINYLSEKFPSIVIPCVVGNHGRRTKKPRAKFRAQDNFDYFVYHMLARDLRHNDKVKFVISESADQLFQVYDTRFLLTHGDQFRGGSGIAGLLSPLMIGDSRKRKREATVNRGYDYLVMGHWHERAMFKNIIVNGSLVGYNEYAFVSNFAYAPPEQSFWVVDPRHGVTVSTPIFVRGAKEKYPQ